MNTTDQIINYIESLPESKQIEIKQLHNFVMQVLPGTELWFIDGKDGNGKIVSNPQIGYGYQQIKYADGKTKAFYQVGISANTSGTSVYIMGLRDKNYLPDTYKDTIGKANVTGYCIKFKKLENINTKVLEKAILDGIKQTS